MQRRAFRQRAPGHHDWFRPAARRLLPDAAVGHSSSGEDGLHVWPPCLGPAANGPSASGRPVANCGVWCRPGAAGSNQAGLPPASCLTPLARPMVGCRQAIALGHRRRVPGPGGKHAPTGSNDVCLRCRPRGHYLSGGVGTIHLVWPQLTDDHRVGLRPTKP